MSSELLEKLVLLILWAVPFAMVLLHLWSFTQGDDPEEEEKE